ncbi:transposase [Luteimonas suaedae]|uniref:transposase n=1 Tax=Luteimonas suaedae TaxID=2605430 RepID=UPI0016597667|nr:transposase [Luteimonas suaedae]
MLPGDLSSRACVCHAGLDVRLHQSGTSVLQAPRISKHGNKYLRRALFLPALAAVQHDPHAKAFKQRLLARGKQKMQANVAVMRKLLTAAWALVRYPDVYDGAKLYLTPKEA